MAKTGNSNPGNFANDKEKAAEAGRKGGQASSGNTSTTGKSSDSQRKGSQSSNSRRG